MELLARRPSRRTVLRGGAAAALGLAAVAGTGTLAGCARDEGPDELEVPLAAAREDVALATAASGRFPALASRLGPVAEDRRAHADALLAEIRRARPDRAEALTTPQATPSTPDLPADAARALSTVRADLGRAQDGAGTLALRTPTPYRCGLLASVAASCAGHMVVLAG